MRNGAEIAAVLLAIPLALSAGLAPAAAQDGTTQEAPDDWEPWFNASHTMRVPVEVSLGDGYPEGWDGPRLVAHELDLTSALREAGWPTDAGGTPQDFSLEPDSVRVVPIGVEDPQPKTALTWQGPVVSERGAFPANHQVVTVAFLADRDVDAYHIYVDQQEDDVTHDPLPRDPAEEQRILQLLQGPGAGHEVYGIAQGEVSFTVGAGYPTSVRAEKLTVDGWSSMGGCGDTVSDSNWITCSETFPADQGAEYTPVRFTAERPITAHGWKTGADAFIGLNGANGYANGTTLLAPAISNPQPVELMSVGDPCEASYSGGSTQVSQVPTRIQLTTSGAITAPCSILGWLPGDDPDGSAGSMPVSIGNETAISGMGMQSERVDVVAVGDSNKRATIVNSNAQTSDERVFNQGSPVHGDHAPFRAGPWPAPNPSDDATYRMGAADTTLWPWVWDGTGDVLPLAPTRTGAIGWVGTPGDMNRPVVKVASVAFDGTSGFGAAISGQDLSTDFGLLSMSEPRAIGVGSDDLDENTGHLVEAWSQRDPKLAASYVVFQEEDTGRESGHAPSTLHGHMRPVDTSTGDPNVIGPVFDVDIDPSSSVAPPGALEEFDVVGQGQFRQPTGEVSQVDVNLNVNITDLATGDEGEASADLGSATASLPIDEADAITDLVVTVPSDVDPEDPPDYRIEVTARATDGEEAVTATANLQVVPDRDLRLTFEDGSSLADLETEDDIATASLVLANEGTTVEDVTLTNSIPEGVEWEIELLDAVSREPIERVDGLQPGASRSLDLRVDASGGSTRVVDIKTVAESTADSSVSDQATARVAHEVDVDVFSSIQPDLVSVNTGDQAEVNLSLINQGSSVNVQVNPRSDENLAMEARESSVNLGENGSDLDSATVPINLTVDQDAPLGSVLVGTLALEIEVGGLEPVESLMSIRVRVVPNHGAEAVGGTSILPGVNQTLEVPVQATGDVAEDLQLGLREVPQGWTVQTPQRLQVPLNTTAPLRLNVSTPAGAPAGAYEIGLEGTPRDGSDPILLTVPVGVEESAAIRQTIAGEVELGVGETRSLVATLENRGNTAGQTTVEATSDLVDVAFRPGTVDLAPGEIRRVTMELVGVQAGEEALEVTSEPGGFSTMNLTVGTVDLSVTVVSTDPATPEAGERFTVVGEVANGGTVAARDVEVALVGAGTVVTNETIGRVAPGEPATLSLGTESLATTQDLRLVVDPEGRYSADEGPSGQAAVSTDETPALAPLAALAATALAAVLQRRR